MKAVNVIFFNKKNVHERAKRGSCIIAFFGQSLSSKKLYIFFIYLQSTVTGNGESIHQINYSVNCLWYGTASDDLK